MRSNACPLKQHFSEPRTLFSPEISPIPASRRWRIEVGGCGDDVGSELVAAHPAGSVAKIVSLAEAAAQAIQIAPRDQQEIEQAPALSNLAA